MECLICHKASRKWGPTCTECNQKGFCNLCMKNAHVKSLGERVPRPMCIICIEKIKLKIENQNQNLQLSTALFNTNPSTNTVNSLPVSVKNSDSEVYNWRTAPGNPCSRCGCSDDRMCLCC